MKNRKQYASFLLPIRQLNGSTKHKQQIKLNKMIRIFKLIIICFWALNPLYLHAQIDYTSYISNQSFENNGLSGWQNVGMQSQTNTSTTSQGWTKDGNVYCERWVATGSNIGSGSISQMIEGLPDGLYRLHVSAHAVNQSGTPEITQGAFLYAGVDELPVNKGGEYTLETVVVGETIEIGFKVSLSDANWVAVDNFRLFNHGVNLGAYREHLAKKLPLIIADTVRKPTHFFNIEQYRSAIQTAQTINLDDIDEVTDAIRLLNTARSESQQIYLVYDRLNKLTNEIEVLYLKTDFPDSNKQIKNMLDEARAVYRSKEDQRNLIEELLPSLEAKHQLLNTYALLWSDLINAKRLLRESDYPNKTAFQTVIHAVQSSTPTTEPIINGFRSNLKNATESYLNGRPTTDWVNIKNGALWKDNRGKSVQAHGAGFLQIGDTWYMIGEDRETAKWNPDVNMYSSKDFVNWKFERKIIQNGKHSFRYPDGSTGSLGGNRMIERPKLLYCANTGKYVVWCHWEAGNYGASEAAVFYCDSINGEYKLHWAGRPLGVKSRDCTVFQDDNGKAYFVSTTEENQHIGLFELSDDYLSVVKHTRLFEWQSREAPAIVKIDGTYFMISSACTGWDPNQAKISYSKSLTGGWSSNQNIGNGIAYDTQPASVLTLQGTEGISYIFVGDRWQDPDLAESKTIMFPVTFNGNSINFTYREQFDLNFATGQWRDTDTKHTRVPKDNWKIVGVSSQEINGENGAAANAIDGNKNTKWHTKYSGGVSPAPHFIEVDMGDTYEVEGFLCTSRMDNSTNGIIRPYVFLVSMDGKKWEAVSGSKWLPYNAELYFKPTEARYFRMEATSGTYACIAELDVLLKTGLHKEQGVVFNTRTGSTGWKKAENAEFEKGSNLTLKANTSGIGTWITYGPNMHFAYQNEYIINELSPEDSGIYSMVFTDFYNQSQRASVEISVISSTGTNNLVFNNQIIKQQYYDLLGHEVSNPTINQVYIIKNTLEDGSSNIEKTSYNNQK